MEPGIVSYGTYIPRYRISPESIGTVWGQDGKAMGKALGIESKSVPAPDEDTVTISVEVARRALRRLGKFDPCNIGAILVGSESHPYAVKPTATIVAEAIGATPHLTAGDLEFACKAGTVGIQACLGMVGMDDEVLPIRYAMAIGSDTSQGAPGNALEYSASAGGTAFLIGRDKVIARILHTSSVTTDTPDFWRREGMKYPSHAERFTGVPAYFKHVEMCAKKVMTHMGTGPSDYTYAVFHQPNGKFPITVAKTLGFSQEQVKAGLWTPKIGNTYSSSMMIGLAGILDTARTGDRILAVSYGSGAGSDGFHIEVTDSIESYDRSAAPSVEYEASLGKFIDYAMYIKFREKIKMEGE
jgi:hydroxymethylglutaryl-CoA synthase